MFNCFRTKKLLLLLSFLAASAIHSFAQTDDSLAKDLPDTSFNGIRDILEGQLRVFHQSFLSTAAGRDTVKNKNVFSTLPYLYIPEVIDGQVSGANMIRPSGEAGVAPILLLRGIATPFGKNTSLYENQPLYVINGVPVLYNNNPYAKSIKPFDISDGVGSGIDIASTVDMDNIASIEILKGTQAVAMYGVLANNGAVVIRTKAPEKGPYKIALNLYGGVAIANTAVYKSNFLPVNASYERDLQLKFYNKYATPQQWADFPHYLADSTNAAYFGAADWDKDYYKNALQHGLSFSITGGTNLANFKFGVSERTQGDVADNTGLQRYGIFYDMYMVPVKRLSIHTYAQANIDRRDRNTSLRERFAEEEYIPDIQYPLPVNSQFLQQYHSYTDASIDKNGASSIQATLQAQYDIWNSLSVHADFSYDYNDNYRDYFSPASLSEANSFVSYFTGVNRRITANSYFLFNQEFKNKQKVHIWLGTSVDYDNLKYDYTRGYRGPSDYVKVIEIPNADGTGDNTHDKRFVYTYKDYMKQNLAAFYGNALYTYKDRYNLALSLRNDGSSFFGNGYMWKLSPSGSFSWELSKESWFPASEAVGSLKLSLDGGRSARTLPMDYYGYGPYYTVNIGWADNTTISSYATIPTLSMPYNTGYTGGGVQMPYTDQWSAGIGFNLFKNIDGNVTYYNKTNKGLLMELPTDASSGFSRKIINGMSVKNAGIEASLGLTTKITTDFKWISSVVFQYNTNKLVSLAGGIKSLQYGDNYLEIGKPVDQFYLLQNTGIYQSEDEVPTAADGQRLTYNGIDFHKGDPIWKDQNQDNVIDEKDKVMTGHQIAPVHGGWTNQLQYKKWDLSFAFIYSFGNSILDAGVANRLNIMGQGEEGDGAINSIAEQTFWMGRNDLGKYPVYNPWSLVNAYQPEQDLFLEKGGYVKLQSITLKYDLSQKVFKGKKNHSLQVYVSGVNLFRISKYSGLYPELSGPSGYDYGYAYPLPVTVTFGLNATF